jgi:hypothetical protein
VPFELGEEPLAERLVQEVHEEIDGLLARQRSRRLWMHTSWTQERDREVRE